MRPGAAILQPRRPLLPIPPHPFGSGLLTDPEDARGGLVCRPAIDNHFGQLLSTVNRQSGILVVVHSVSLKNCLLVTTSFSCSDRMDNLLKLHTRCKGGNMENRPD